MRRWWTKIGLQIFDDLKMLQQSCYNNDGSERVFLCGKMSQNVVRGGEKSKTGEKGDGIYYFPCKKCCT